MAVNNLKNELVKLIVLSTIGGYTYYGIELLWRGYSHFSMIIVGGLCFVIIGAINNYLPWKMSLIWQMLIAAVAVTTIEFIAGVIINIWLGLGVWDYNQMPFNLLGQICLLYFFLWMPLSIFAIFLDDFIRYKLFDEEKPHYTII